MKTRREKAILIAFLGTTVSLAAFLSYTLYVWVGVALLLKRFDADFAINTVTVEDQGNSTWVYMTTTITNSFQGSHISLFASIQIIYIGQTQIRLYHSGGQPQYDGAPFVRELTLSPLESKTANFNFAVPFGSISAQNISGATFLFRVLATTLVNQDPIGIEFNQTYTGPK